MRQYEEKGGMRHQKQGGEAGRLEKISWGGVALVFSTGKTNRNNDQRQNGKQVVK